MENELLQSLKTNWERFRDQCDDGMAYTEDAFIRHEAAVHNILNRPQPDIKPDAYPYDTSKYLNYAEVREKAKCKLCLDTGLTQTGPGAYKDCGCKPDAAEALKMLAWIPNDPYNATLECADFIYKHRNQIRAALQNTHKPPYIADENGNIRPALQNAGAHEDIKRLTKELDIALNGEEGAAVQASLCDIVAQVKNEKWKLVQNAGAQWQDISTAVLGVPVLVLRKSGEVFSRTFYQKPQTKHGWAGDPPTHWLPMDALPAAPTPNAEG